MTFHESALVFNCRGESLVGILSMPEQRVGTVGVIIVVGGPQYRIGSHRHFVLLSRHLAESGIPCLRFDYRGMGDSTGDARDFTSVADDIRAAVDTFLERSPGVQQVVLWGLCDGATAAAFYAAGDSRISGVVLLNPWVHTEQAEAIVYLKHYYLRRLASAAFWQKLVAGEVRPVYALGGALRMIRRAWSRNLSRDDTSTGENLPLPERLYRSLTTRQLQIFILLSGKDFVAHEFEGLTVDQRWARLVDSAALEQLPYADHTLSDPSETNRVNRLTVEWIKFRLQGA